MKYVCQSCSMPLNKDPKFFAPKKGETVVDYCSFCYENGEFKKPHITLPEMQKFVIAKLKSLGVPTVFAWFFSRRVSKLKRWKK